MIRVVATILSVWSLVVLPTLCRTGILDACCLAEDRPARPSTCDDPACAGEDATCPLEFPAQSDCLPGLDPCCAVAQPQNGAAAQPTLSLPALAAVSPVNVPAVLRAEFFIRLTTTFPRAGNLPFPLSDRPLLI